MTERNERAAHTIDLKRRIAAKPGAPKVRQNDLDATRRPQRAELRGCLISGYLIKRANLNMLNNKNEHLEAEAEATRP